MKEKRFALIVLFGIITGLILFAVPIIVIDPYFHYHAPLKELYYPIDNERYQNNGISRNFSYDAMITGTSMSENFKTSDLDRLFGVHSIKVPYSGGTYGEINRNILAALENNKDLKMVVRAIDYTGLIKDKDFETHENRVDYPHYLNDNNIFNDVYYIFNKEVLDLCKNIVKNTKKGGMTPFDEYANWNALQVYGKEAVLKTYIRAEESPEEALSEPEKEMIRENIRQNVVSTAIRYPDTVFYLFISPYSVCYWDGVKRSGQLNYHIEAERIAIEEMLGYDNIKLFSFTNHFGWTSNLDNYKDQAHYGEWINTAILECMQKGEYQLTEENYKEYLEEIQEFYTDYDYGALYE